MSLIEEADALHRTSVLIETPENVIPTMSFMSDVLVGMLCSPRRPARRRDFSLAISSNSRCFSVSLSDTGIGMASVASITRDAILLQKKRKENVRMSCHWICMYNLVRHHTDIKKTMRITLKSKHNPECAASDYGWLKFSSTRVGS